MPTECKKDALAPDDRISSLDRFQWVACQFDALTKCAKPSELRRTLASLPKDLDETYKRVLRGIEELWQDDVHKVLEWLCFALDYVNLDEIVDALAVDGSKFDPEERYPDPRDVLTRCSSLVLVTVGLDDREVLRLTHLSVKEYLLSDRIREGEASWCAIDSDSANERIAQACLAYLLQFNTVDCPDDSTIRNHPLAHYASRYWLKHFQHIGTQISIDLERLIKELFKKSDTQRVSCTAPGDTNTCTHSRV